MYCSVYLKKRECKARAATDMRETETERAKGMSDASASAGETLEEAGADGERVGRRGARRRRRLRGQDRHAVGGRVDRLERQLLVGVERLHVRLQDGPRVRFAAVPTRRLFRAVRRAAGRGAELRAPHRHEAAVRLLNHHRRVGRLHDDRLRAACTRRAHRVSI